MPLRRRISGALGRLELRGSSLLVAVSGGIDSVTLLDLLQDLSEEFDLKLSVGHVNHGLRGDESEADQAFVEGLAARRGLPVETARVHPREAREGGNSRDRPSPQEAARRLRYAALGQLARRAGAQRIATAHTRDDQAETLLLRLLRGTGPDGLGGIPERSADGRLVRPLLAVGRSEIERHAGARGLVWREDASNRDPAYARNRLRSRWLPGLAREFNPQLLRTLSHLAEAQREDAAWIEAEVEREAAARLAVREHGLSIDARGWAGLPRPLSRRLARSALQRCGAARLVSRVHLERMSAFLADARPGRVLELPGGLRLRPEGRDRFVLAPGGSRRAPEEPC
jgi:tRNA(Ile)-lysidine synthase